MQILFLGNFSCHIDVLLCIRNSSKKNPLEMLLKEKTYKFVKCLHYYVLFKSLTL